MVWPCEQNASGKAYQTSFICKSKKEKASGTTTNMLGRLHWGSWSWPVIFSFET